jgi:hypothetical protein
MAKAPTAAEKKVLAIKKAVKKTEVMHPDLAAAAAQAGVDIPTVSIKKPTLRVVRKPLQARGPLSVSGDRDPEYKYRFVNDKGSRIRQLTQLGYEFVTDEDLSIGDQRVVDASELGSSKSVISNDGTQSFLMRIKKEYYDEDQKVKMDDIAAQEEAMKPAPSDMYGGISISRS